MMVLHFFVSIYISAWLVNCCKGFDCLSGTNYPNFVPTLPYSGTFTLQNVPNSLQTPPPGHVWLFFCAIILLGGLILGLFCAKLPIRNHSPLFHLSAFSVKQALPRPFLRTKHIFRAQTATLCSKTNRLLFL